MKKKALITGANGFIGRSLMRCIQTKYPSWDVAGIDLTRSNSSTKVFACDLTESNKVASILKNVRPHYIFHLSGGRRGDEVQLYQSNFVTTKILLDAISRINDYRPRIVIPGTAAEYGKIDPSIKLVDEHTIPQPRSFYGFIKYMQTSLGLMYAKKGLDVIIARMFNILGAGTPVTLSIGKFVQEIVAIERGRKDKTIHAYSLSGQRDFLDVDDICVAWPILAQQGRSGQIYNICSAKAFGIRDLLKRLIRMSTVRGVVIRENNKAISESFDVIGSNGKIKRETDWRPVYSIEESLRRTLQYYRQNR